MSRNLLPALNKLQNAFFRRESTEEKNITVMRGRRCRIESLLHIMGNNVQLGFRQSHLNVQIFLCRTQRYPGAHPIKRSESTNPGESNSHEAACDTALSPALCFEGGKKVTVNASAAWLPVIQKKTVYTREPVIMQEMNNRPAQLKSRVINCRR